MDRRAPTTDSTETTRTTHPYRHVIRQIASITIFLSIVAVQPVLGETNAICSAAKLPGMIQGFFQITTTLGIVGLAVVWQADSLIDMFTISPEQKKGVKRHKRTALKSTVILVVLGPLYTVAGSVMGLPLASCVNLAPW